MTAFGVDLDAAISRSRRSAAGSRIGTLVARRPVAIERRFERDEDVVVERQRPRRLPRAARVIVVIDRERCPGRRRTPRRSRRARAHGPRAAARSQRFRSLRRVSHRTRVRRRKRSVVVQQGSHRARSNEESVSTWCVFGKRSRRSSEERRQPDAISRLASREKVTGSQERYAITSRVFSPDRADDFGTRPGARRIEEEEVGVREAVE